MRLFQHHLLEQADYLLRAMHSVRNDPYRLDVWRDIQSVVLAAGNMSKLLWGQGGKRTAQRAALRQSIGVVDDSPLRLTRMRNHFEHVDERLDLWWQDSLRHNHLDRLIGPNSAAEGLEDVERFRSYDPESGSLWFWGDELNLTEIEAEVERVYPRLKAEAEKPHWQP